MVRGISFSKGPFHSGLLNLCFSLALFLLHHDFLQRKVSAESRQAGGEGMQANLDEKAFTVYASFPISFGFCLLSLTHKQIKKLKPSLQSFSQGKVSPLPSFTFRHCAHKMAAAACGWAWRAQEAAFLFSHPACPGTPSAFIFCGILLLHSSVQIQGGLHCVIYAWNGSWGGKWPVCMRRGPVGPQCLFFC